MTINPPDKYSYEIYHGPDLIGIEFETNQPLAHLYPGGRLFLSLDEDYSSPDGYGLVIERIDVFAHKFRAARWTRYRVCVYCTAPD
jgi:hypothetical protein